MEAREPLRSGKINHPLSGGKDGRSRAAALEQYPQLPTHFCKWCIFWTASKIIDLGMIVALFGFIAP